MTTATINAPADLTALAVRINEEHAAAESALDEQLQGMAESCAKVLGGAAE